MSVASWLVRLYCTLFSTTLVCVREAEHDICSILASDTLVKLVLISMFFVFFFLVT